MVCDNSQMGDIVSFNVHDASFTLKNNDNVFLLYDIVSGSVIR